MSAPTFHAVSYFLPNVHELILCVEYTEKFSNLEEKKENPPLFQIKMQSYQNNTNYRKTVAPLLKDVGTELSCV